MHSQILNTDVKRSHIMLNSPMIAKCGKYNKAAFMSIYAIYMALLLVFYYVYYFFMCVLKSKLAI